MIAMTYLFKWNESFLTHLSSVDEQHKRLVGLINDLAEMVATSEVMEPQAFASVRDDMLNYARVHFSDEEMLMEKAGLDKRHVERHRAEHQSFVNEVMALEEAGGNMTPEGARGLVEYLVNWLAYHILTVDQSMARQMLAIRDGLSAAGAFDDDARYVQSGTEPLLAALKVLFQAVTERNHELRIINRELEERVKQRTVELEHANRQLQLQAVHDDLTGLPNRRFAIMTLRQLWAEAQRYGNPLSVLMLDADHFKEVNDRFGHNEGDVLLKALARRLRESVRSSDIVCRLGGDEFLLICPRSSRIEAATVGKKILAAQRPFKTANGVECWNGALSIGVAEVGPQMVQAEDLMKAADQALYIAKRQGGARMVGGYDV